MHLCGVLTAEPYPPIQRREKGSLTAAAAACSPLRGIYVVCNENSVAFRVTIAAHTSVGESFSFFASFFLFSKEKKKRVIAQQTPKNSIDRLHKQ